MKNFIRSKTSKKSIRLIKGDYNLDLTYVTPRILAMSYPAQSFIKKLYRNDINSIAKYLKEEHDDNYWIYNTAAKNL